jgi:hypothetical protein
MSTILLLQAVAVLTGFFLVAQAQAVIELRIQVEHN